MTLRHKALTGALAALLSSAALVQAATAADTAAPTKEQLRAEMHADRAANHALAKKVREALLKSKELNDTDIAVFANSRSGKVTLAGTILDESQDQVAQDLASKVPGVQSVTSKLTLYAAP
ncbi:BON domain-containing protein [Paraburkholderia sp. MMS20-SJTN17]|uniref:BON domain-containing protein n=1 Tax=Paraburkholderia translucens TaxID=2886945 RepID=A0ABS8K9S1_9BURK|nr:BON domain-containing protein [Paraburkholderia sp. MMS20-SJTN17]MCC8401510.1 BON domain-containing protein [Paraburkholderia sp. MMS20-SJTN17]